MANPSSNLLSLLADDIKLSLLERQRSVSIGLEPDAQNGNIARSLESMREGIEALEGEAQRMEDRSDGSAQATRDDAKRLRSQYDDLTSQFHGIASTTTITTSATATTNTTTSSVPPQQNPNAASYDDNDDDDSPFSANTLSPSAAGRRPAGGPPSPAASKSVRFRDTSPDAQEEATRAALFPYRDDPSALEAQRPDQSGLSNSQIHAYHDQVMAEQDEQLDRLGESIGRQRELGMRIGDELDEHVAMLDDVDRHVDRQQGRLQGARDRIGKIARRANDNKQLTTIVILIVILLLLIIILKT